MKQQKDVVKLNLMYISANQKSFMVESKKTSTTRTLVKFYNSLLTLCRTYRYQKYQCKKPFILELNRHDRLYTVDQVCELIKKSSKNDKFVVHKVQSLEILDFKTW